MGIFEDLSIQKEQPRLLDIEEGLYRCSPKKRCAEPIQRRTSHVAMLDARGNLDSGSGPIRASSRYAR